MRRKQPLAWATGAALVAALGVGAAWWRGGAPASSERANETDANGTRGLATLATTPDGIAVSRDPHEGDRSASLAPWADSPEARAALAAQAERERFEKTIRDFLANAAALDAAERARIAAELDAQVEAEELAARMSADEARMLRLALIERGVADAEERLRRAEALADAYRREAEQRRQDFERQQADDPRFRAYKAREAQVVAEVAALRTIPGGVSRDEYLRQRLQLERERAYAANPGG